MDIKQFLNDYGRKDLIRFSTMGSVDDGKSTLIGRLLQDSKAIYEDHLQAVKRYTDKHAAVKDNLELALLLDGLKSEREQGITIDVAYRYFSTPHRKFIIADTPGHVQYTRNMATGASTADLAIVIIDAAQGVLPQSRRHSFIAALLGIKHIVVAVNKMDLVDYKRNIFEEIKQDFTNFAARLEVSDIHFIPISALHGDNVVNVSNNMPWFHGSPLIEYLESVHIASDRNLIDLRFPVQSVLRAEQDFRGYSGTVASGIVRRGDEVVVLPSGLRTRVERIVTYDGDLEAAFPPLAVTLTLEDDIDISRGDMLCHVNNVPDVSREIEAMIVWMSEEPMVAGKPYLIKHTTSTLSGNFTDILYRININTMHREKTDRFELNEIGRAVLSLNQPILHDAYTRNRNIGCFVIIDRFTNNTVGAGTIIDRTRSKLSSSAPGGLKTQKNSPDYGVSEADRSEAESADLARITSEHRAERKGHRGLALWLSDPDSADLAGELETFLFYKGCDVFVLDDTQLQRGLNRNLGSSPEDRSERIRRMAELGKLFTGAGLLVIAPCPANYEDEGETDNSLYPDGSFDEICIHLETAGEEKKSLKATIPEASGQISKDAVKITVSQTPKVTGETPAGLDDLSREKCIEAIVNYLKTAGVIR